MPLGEFKSSNGSNRARAKLALLGFKGGRLSIAKYQHHKEYSNNWNKTHLIQRRISDQRYRDNFKLRYAYIIGSDNRKFIGRAIRAALRIQRRKELLENAIAKELLQLPKLRLKNRSKRLSRKSSKG